MSNVLIGIIGVILFIGLALAGALFLGQRFQDASVDSKAAAGVQAMAQMANAISLMQLDDGRPFKTGQSLVNNPDGPIARGYLKSLPRSPINPLYAPFVVDNDSLADGGDATFVAVTLESSTNALAEKVCLRMVRQTGQDASATVVPSFTKLPSNPVGCMRATLGAAGTLNSGFYYIFAKI